MLDAACGTRLSEFGCEEASELTVGNVTAEFERFMGWYDCNFVDWI